MSQSDYEPGPFSVTGGDQDGGRDGGRHGGQGSQPNSGGTGTNPSFPFSITITIEIKGESTCPPDVKVRKG